MKARRELFADTLSKFFFLPCIGCLNPADHVRSVRSLPVDIRKHISLPALRELQELHCDRCRSDIHGNAVGYICRIPLNLNIFFLFCAVIL